MTCAGARAIKFILDANFLTIPSHFKVDVFDELESFGKTFLYTLDRVVEELQVLAGEGGKTGGHARIGLHLIKKNGIRIIKTKDHEANTDDLIVKVAMDGYVVCTQDKELIRKLKRSEVPVVSLRQGRYLEWVK